MSATQTYKTLQETARREQLENALACFACAGMIAAPVVAWAFGFVG